MNLLPVTPDRDCQQNDTAAASLQNGAAGYFVNFPGNNRFLLTVSRQRSGFEAQERALASNSLIYRRQWTPI
ncbi:hypothetical protein N0M98_16560 [Paenibacillus doosanensis]|nr:hypothetical protein [Paenibacillus doosanensis]